jgi:hypothetical protein
LLAPAKKNSHVAVTKGIQTNLYKTKTVLKIVTPRCTKPQTVQENKETFQAMLCFNAMWQMKRK